MKLLDAVAAYLDWAMAPAGPPPCATPRHLLGLLRPGKDVRTAAAELAAVEAARLRMGTPPLGDDTPAGPGGLWLAAALCLRDQEAVASEVAHACPALQDTASAPAASVAAWDLLLRHAVVGPALSAPSREAFALSAVLADELRAASPLTAVLERPWRGGDDVALAHLRWLRDRPDGRRLLVASLSVPIWPVHAERERPVLAWRARLLARLATGDHEERTFVLDVYETALVHHGARFLDQVDWARTALVSPESPDESLATALDVARWWQPLVRLRRTWPVEIEARHEIDVHALIAIGELRRIAQALGGENM
jgi:hypothetical protein